MIGNKNTSNSGSPKVFSVPREVPGMFRTVVSNWEGIPALVNFHRDRRQETIHILNRSAANSALTGPPDFALDTFFKAFSHFFAINRYADPFFRMNSRILASRATVLSDYVRPFHTEGGFGLSPEISSQLMLSMTRPFGNFTKLGVPAKYIEASLRLLVLKRLLSNDYNPDGTSVRISDRKILVDNLIAAIPNHQRPYHFQVYSKDVGDTSETSLSITPYYIRLRTAPIPQTGEEAAKFLFKLMKPDLDYFYSLPEVRSNYVMALFSDFPHSLHADFYEVFKVLTEPYRSKVNATYYKVIGTSWLFPYDLSAPLPPITDAIITNLVNYKKFRGPNPYISE